MNKNLVSSVGSCSQDNLIAKLSPAAEAFGIIVDKLATEKTLTRGTVMARGSSTGKYFVLGETYTYETHADFVGDGTEVTFVVSDKPASLSSLTVDGVVKTSGTDFTYTAATGAIVFTSAPADEKSIVATYNKADSGTAACVLSDDVVVGTTEDAPAVAYRSGNFNRSAITVATGYTLTSADEDALRKYDIIFTDVM